MHFSRGAGIRRLTGRNKAKKLILLQQQLEEKLISNQKANIFSNIPFSGPFSGFRLLNCGVSGACSRER